MYSNKVTFVLRQRETFYEKRKSPFFQLHKGTCIFFMGLEEGRLVGLGGQAKNNPVVRGGGLPKKS